ncbi:anti-sigma-D factor RsdA, partial [Mycolicibacterium palauense]|uniref:anti-sigma-D factor RsdA n=1 Tax=Mycolicibacterium palauense TaxID=2034511 RepID=UPI001FE4D13D
MADFTRGAGSGGGESLDAIAATDRLLDALADQRHVRPADPDDAELFAMLEGWRDGIRTPSSSGLVSEQEAIGALQDGLAARPGQHRPRRSLAVVASLAAAVLGIGGFGAVVAGSGPGDPLYGMRTAIFGEQAAVRDDRVALAAKTEMAQVQQMIEQGDWEQAQQKLQAVSTQVQSVDNVDTKTDLIQQWNELSVKVGTRDPQATLPP